MIKMIVDINHKKKNSANKCKALKHIVEKYGFLLLLIFVMLLGLFFDMVLTKKLTQSNSKIFAFFWMILLKETVFNDNIYLILALCSTVGSISFSFFSFAKNYSINNQEKLLINNDFFDLLDIKTTYNPWVFLSILFIYFAFVFKLYIFFYSMLGYQVFSFIFCIKNYLIQIDEKRLKDCINRKLKKMKYKKRVFSIMQCYLLNTYNNNKFSLKYSENLFIEFDDSLDSEFEKQYDSSVHKDKYRLKNYNQFESVYLKGLVEVSKRIIESLLSNIESKEEKSKVIYSLLIIISPGHLKNIKNSQKLKFFKKIDFNLEYIVLYYLLIQKLIELNPEMFMNKDLMKIMSECLEVNYAIILFLQNKYYNKYLISDIEYELYTKSLEISEKSKTAFYLLFSQQKHYYDIFSSVIISCEYYFHDHKKINDFYSLSCEYNRIKKQIIKLSKNHII